MIKTGRRLPLFRAPTPSRSPEEWVEVRSKEEILRTLDEKGELENMPFMPEMFQYCGKRLRVFRRAHKTCDTVNRSGGRRVDKAVHLEDARCDGSAHGGCNAACLFFWKEAWLKPVAGPAHEIARVSARTNGSTGCTEETVIRNACVLNRDAEAIYSCQATRLPAFTHPLPWWDVRQYVEDYTSGNEPLTGLVSGFAYAAFQKLVRVGYRPNTGFGEALVNFYDRFQKLRGGVPFPRRMGTVPPGQPTPASSLRLQPGELVRVKPYTEILQTLDASSKNRGLFFDAEEVPYCERTYRVRSRVERIVDERTGKMIKIKDAVILEGAWCRARYSDRRLFCPRAVYPFWKEIWLERVNAEPAREHSISTEGQGVS